MNLIKKKLNNLNQENDTFLMKSAEIDKINKSKNDTAKI